MVNMTHAVNNTVAPIMIYYICSVKVYNSTECQNPDVNLLLR